MAEVIVTVSTESGPIVLKGIPKLHNTYGMWDLEITIWPGYSHRFNVDQIISVHEPAEV